MSRRRRDLDPSTGMEAETKQTAQRPSAGKDDEEQTISGQTRLTDYGTTRGEKSKKPDKDEKTPACSTFRSASFLYFRLLVCLLAGIVFGICLEKSRVFEPKSIQWQFLCKRWIMLKVFLAALASGQLCFIVLSLLPWTREDFQKVMEGKMAGFSSKGVFTSALGPFILGSGMALSGACPGMLLTQIGAWTKNAYFTLAGGLIGALVYGFFAPVLIKISRPKEPIKKYTIHEQLGVHYAIVATPMMLLLTAIVFLMEYYIPWSSELDVPNAAGSNIATARAWPPAAAGAVIGGLQLVTVFTVGRTLSGTSAYSTLVSQWVFTKRLQEWFPYFAAARCGIKNWWLVFYAAGAVLGGTISSLASNTIATTSGVNYIFALCGGIAMIAGAKYAAGCTSGHGLSGMALLGWLSAVAVPFMFIGGIATVFILQATDFLSPDVW